MRVPESLDPLVEQGVIEQVVRPLMSGKEAQVFLVRSQGELRVAKVYKESDRRSFKHRAAYTEGRRVRNSRTQRAMESRTRFGREMEEQAWRRAELDAIERLRAADVRVPEPFAFVDGVLVMELIQGPDGGPAPRLCDLDLSEEQAESLFFALLREVVKMLCAGVVHGDLSDFNVLIDADGPVIIDLPQWVDAATNNRAGELLIRDVSNLTSFLARFAPKLKKGKYGREMWQLYERGDLTPTTKLTGRPAKRDAQANLDAILAEIQASEREATARREALGLPPPRRARAPKVHDAPPPAPVKPKAKKDKERPAPQERDRSREAVSPRPAPADQGPPPDGPKPGGRRRKRKRGRGPDGPAPAPPTDDLDRFLLEDG